MASVKFTFWTSNTQQVQMNVPYLGDVTNAANGTPNDYPWYIVNSTGNFNVIKQLNFIDAGRRATNLLVRSQGGSLTYGNSNSMTHGVQSTYQTFDTTSISRVETFGSGTNSNMGARNDRCDFAGLALATVNGTMYLGFMLTGTSVVTGETATFFLTNTASNSQFKYIYDNTIHKGDPYNPYSPGDYSGPGGGNGDFGEDSDSVTTDALPDQTEYSAVACGFSTIFLPEASQLRQLAEAFWGTSLRGALQDLLTGISDFFVSLGIVPFSLAKGRLVTCTWLDIATIEIPLYLAPKQWYEFDMGNIYMTNNSFLHDSGSVLDYSPYSKLGIYLPFIGYEELDVDECRNNVINLRYRIDILSGAALALIDLIDSNGVRRTLYQFTGNCLMQIPLSSQDMTGVVTNAVNVGIAMAGVGAASAIASAGEAAAAEQISAGKISQTQADLNATQRAASVSRAEGSLGSATANALMGMKPNYKRSGAVGGATSIFGVMQPFLVLTTPRQSMPEGYEKVCGFPCNMGGTLGSFSGFTVVEDIRLNNLVATSSEVEEIYDLLKSGVII